MQFLVPGYLEQAMVSFARNQEQMRDNLRATFGMLPFGPFEEMGKQNLAMFERAMRMMSPYARHDRIGQPRRATPPAAEPEKEDPNPKRLEAQIEALRHQLVRRWGKKG